LWVQAPGGLSKLPQPPARDVAAAGARAGLTDGEVALVCDVVRSFEAEVRDLEPLRRSDAEGFASLARERSLAVLADLRASLGATKVNHLLSDEVLKPISRFAFSSRPTVYPPPQPDPPPSGAEGLRPDAVRR
jgi:hypothetical protein